MSYGEFLHLMGPMKFTADVTKINPGHEGRVRDVEQWTMVIWLYNDALGYARLMVQNQSGHLFI